MVGGRVEGVGMGVEKRKMEGRGLASKADTNDPRDFAPGASGSESGDHDEVSGQLLGFYMWRLVREAERAEGVLWKIRLFCRR